MDLKKIIVFTSTIIGIILVFSFGYVVGSNGRPTYHRVTISNTCTLQGVLKDADITPTEQQWNIIYNSIVSSRKTPR